jgi:hypothetical protein
MFKHPDRTDIGHDGEMMLSFPSILVGVEKDGYAHS